MAKKPGPKPKERPDWWDALLHEVASGEHSRLEDATRAAGIGYSAVMARRYASPRLDHEWRLARARGDARRALRQLEALEEATA